MEKKYHVEFVFIENGHTCHTNWTGSAKSEAEAKQKAEKLFGFEEDGIQVLSCEVD